MKLLRNKKALSVFAVAVVCAVAGVVAWVMESVGTHGGMGLSNAVPWGSSMALFIVFVGLATGCLIVASASVLFGWKTLQGLCGVAASAGLAASVGGVFYIMSDLGTFANILNMITGFNVRSLLSWDMVALPLFMVADIVFLLSLRFGKRMKGAAVFALLASVALLFVDAWIFAFMTSREAWNSSLMLPWFIVSAVSSGLALTVVVSAAFGKRFSGNVPVCTAIAVLAGLDAAIAVTETALGFYHGAGADLAVSNALVSGGLAPCFWFEIVASVVAIVLALRARCGGSNAAVVAAGALVILAVCAKRLYFIASGFVVPLMPEPSAEGIMAFAAANAATVATPMSVVLALGGIGILVALFLIARALVPAGLEE